MSRIQLPQIQAIPSSLLLSISHCKQSETIARFFGIPSKSHTSTVVTYADG